MKPLDRDLGAVARQLLAEFGQHRVLVLLARHVDEVDDDDAAQVAQPQLARDGLRRLEVGLEDRVVEVARADEAAGVDVDRGQRLGLVDDQVAAGLQVDAPRQRAGDLLVDVVEVEDRPLALVAAASLPRSPSACKSRRTGAPRRTGRSASMRIALVRSLARSRSTRSTRLRSWCSSAAGRQARGLLADRAPGLAQVSDVRRRVPRRWRPRRWCAG